MGFFRYRTATGERRFWSLRDIVRGRTIGRPTHPIFVTFPLALFPGALLLDVLSRLRLSGAALAGTYAVLGGLIGAVFAILTGLLDRAAMRPGSLVRRVATRHMWLQLAATAIFAVDLAVRWPHRHRAQAEVLWLVLSALGMLTIIVGGDVGFRMVFRMGVRVGTDGPETAEAPPGVAAGAAVPGPLDSGR